jgi:hypothetical protein
MIKNLLLIIVLFLLVQPVEAARKYVGVIIPRSAVTTEAQEKEVTNFATELGKVVKDNWYPKEYKGKYRSIIRVSFDEFDQAALTVSEPSGDASFDQSAKVAIERSITNHYPHKNIAIEFVFNYRNTGFFSEIPVLSSIWRIPARIGAGYVADRLGLNEVIFIGI